ncbi:FHA domain-containing protein [Chitinimonas sp. PSY-7]|uniref:FHA domain-containing protein n=1 Tax=Chitinimonas sp. PSY-7 TaxID=3459088 RepID=UPI00404009A3
MAKLVLSLDGVTLREVKLERDTLRIGRKPHNDLQIDNLAVSGEHARLSIIGQDLFIDDLDSTNGTMVNGKPIQRQLLQDNDVVEIGKYRLKYQSEGGVKSSRPPQDDLDRTMVIRPGDLRPMPPAGQQASAAADTVMELPTPAPAPVPTPTAAVPPPVSNGAAVPEPHATAVPVSDASRPAAIKVLSGANAGKSLDLTKNLTSLGKPGVQVAIITRRHTAYFLTHVEGGSRPLVNGRQIGVQAEALKNHDVIELAGIRMEFFYK